MASTLTTQKFSLAAFIFSCFLIMITHGFGGHTTDYGKRSLKVIVQRRRLLRDTCNLALDHCPRNTEKLPDFGFTHSDTGTSRYLNKRDAKMALSMDTNGQNEMNRVSRNIYLKRRDVKSDILGKFLRDLCNFAVTHCRAYSRSRKLYGRNDEPRL